MIRMAKGLQNRLLAIALYTISSDLAIDILNYLQWYLNHSAYLPMWWFQ